MKDKRVIGILCFSDMSNEINSLLFYLVVFVPLLYMLEPVMTNLRMEQKINSRTKEMQGDLMMGNR